MENNKVMLRIAGSQQGEQQIATFANRVREIVPAYRLKIPEDETITIVKNAVKDSTYAPWSENNTMEGMYIQAHMINDGNSDKTEAGYADNQLVAIVDLNYRFLTPINPDVPVAPGTPDPNVIVSTTVDGDGCATIDNSLKTINFDNDNIARYYAILRVKPGFKRIPNGRLEMQIDHEQNGDNAWREVLSWENETEVEINCENVVGNLRFVFEEECVYNLTIKRTLNGESWPACPIGETEVIEKHCSDVIDTNSAEIKKPITSYLINSVTPSGEISPCTNTEITVDYKPANSRIVVRWLDIEHNNKEIISAEDTLGFDEELNPLDYEDDYTFEGEYEGYEVKRTVPNKIIRGDGQEHTIEIYCGLKEFKVTYKGDEHVTVVESDGITPVDPETPVIVKYGQSVDPNKKFVIGGDYSVSILPSGNAVVTKDDESKTISVTNVKSDVVVTLSSVENVRVTSITADQIDAMGGVKLTAHLSNDTEDSNPEHFTINSYQIGTEAKVEDINQSDISQVYDYVAKDLVDKKVISNLEWPNTSSSTRNVLLGVTYNQYGSTEDEISTTQRAETYGYYEGGLKSDSNSSKLKEIDTNTTTTNWKTGYLVDFGDSCNMYGDEGPTEQTPDKVKIGLDIYNKDITPYYIPGTDIGKNPLINITSDNVTYVQSGKVVSNINNFKAKLDFNKPENNDHNYEHYHILWQEQSKGKIFTRDLLTSEISYCGLYDEDCGCSPKSEVSKVSEIYTLEAGLKTDTGAIMQIQKTPDVLYRVYYKDPSHNYGRDSISYYHTQLEKYAAKVDGEVFRDSNSQLLNFSYPVHINSASDNYGNIPERSNYAISWSNNYFNDYYKFSSVRWESAITNSILTPDNNSYNQYYDYSNRIDLLGDYNNKDSKTINISKYNLKYYTGGDDFNSLSVGDSYNSSDAGREVTVYYTMMSPENQVRPTNPTENVYKFIKLDGIYNGADYSQDYNYGLNLIELEDVGTYISEKDNHVTYISSNYKNKDGVYEPLNDSQKYLYNKHEDYSTVRELGKNKDYSYKCENKGYTSINAPITENLQNGIYYPYRLYNLSTGIQIRQYYNDPSETETHFSEADHYLHNGHMTKYVACTEGFDSANYYIYYPKNEEDENELLKWWINNLPNVTNISSGGYESGSYIYSVDVTVNGVTTTHSCKSRTSGSISLECFYELTYELAPIYTNANSVTVEFLGGCNAEGNKCGVGSFKMKINGNEYPLNGPDSESWRVPPAALTVGDLSGNSEIRIIANTRSLDLINSMLNLDRREFIKGHYDLYLTNMFTGGGRFKVTAEWTNTEAEVIDTRILVIDMSGTCKHGDNPNKEGCTMPWEYLVKYYKYYNGSRYDNTKGDTMLDWIGPEKSTNNEQLS